MFTRWSYTFSPLDGVKITQCSFKENTEKNNNNNTSNDNNDLYRVNV